MDSVKAISDEIRHSPDEISAWDNLIALTKDGDLWNRYYAYSFLAELVVENVGNKADAFISVLVDGLKDQEHHIRHRCIVALKNVGAKGVNAAAAELVEIVKQRREDDITWDAAEALGHVTDSEVALVALEEVIRIAADPAPPGTDPSAPQLRGFAMESAKMLFREHYRDVEKTKFFDQLMKRTDATRHADVNDVVKELQE